MDRKLALRKGACKKLGKTLSKKKIADIREREKLGSQRNSQLSAADPALTRQKTGNRFIQICIADRGLSAYWLSLDLKLATVCLRRCIQSYQPNY